MIINMPTGIGFLQKMFFINTFLDFNLSIDFLCRLAKCELLCDNIMYERYK